MDFSLIKPLDQPVGNRRLLEEIRAGLNVSSFSDLFITVAYAKSGPFLRLREDFEKWRDSGRRISAIFGIDQKGTSIEALELALELFDSVYVIHKTGITFHPKSFIFEGETHARAIIGSNNLTVGGTERNFESAVLLEFSLPEDQHYYCQVKESWEELLPANCPATFQLNATTLAALAADDLVIPERSMRSNSINRNIGRARSGKKKYGAGLKIIPESPLPKPKVAKPKAKTKAATQSGKAKASKQATRSPYADAQTLVMQIVPHHNSEIFLSMTALRQNPAFFGHPFTGTTTPKKANNQGYPQRSPDPRVNITVYDAAATPIYALQNYGLNTVEYTPKSELRITIAQAPQHIPPNSVMIMEPSAQQGIDYDIIVYTPASPDYKMWVDRCDQKMPGGRKFGWF